MKVTLMSVSIGHQCHGLVTALGKAQSWLHSRPRGKQSRPRGRKGKGAASQHRLSRGTGG